MKSTMMYTRDDLSILDQEDRMSQTPRYERDILKAENARLRAALAPFAALRLYPDDVGEDLAAMIRIDDDWNEQENEDTRDEVLVRRRDVRTARIALKRTEGNDGCPDDVCP